MSVDTKTAPFAGNAVSLPIYLIEVLLKNIVYNIKNEEIP